MRPDVRAVDAFVGREEELALLVRNLVLGRHTLVVGVSGVGKTRLLEEARRVLAGRSHRIELPGGLGRSPGSLAIPVRAGSRRVIVLGHPAPLSGCVRDALRALWELGDLPVAGASWSEARKELAGLGAAELRALVLEGMTRADVPYIVLLDGVERVSALQAEFFGGLMLVATLCVAGTDPRAAAGTAAFWLSFERLVLPPLAPGASSALLDRLTDAAPVLAADPVLYRRELLASTEGNPAALRALHWRSSLEPVLPLEGIRALRRSERARYFNMGPLYIFGVALLTLVRILAIGTGDIEFVIYFSALGFVAYLAFRVFRPFFVFRPRGEDGVD